MNITETELLLLTGYSVMLGVALALCYAVFSFMRMLISPSDPKSAKGRALCDVVFFMADVLYALFAGVCVSLMFFGLNHGRVRLVGLFGCAIGFCLCHFTLGRWLTNSFSRCVCTLRKIILIIYRHSVGAVLSLIKRVIKALFKPMIRTVRNRKKVTKRKAKDEKLEFLG